MQVMAVEAGELVLLLAIIPFENLLHRSLHVVMALFLRRPLKKIKCGRLRFKQHLLCLSRIRLHQPRTRIGHNLWVFDPTLLPYAHEITALLIREAFFQRLFMPLDGHVRRSHLCFLFVHSTCSSPARLGAGEEQVEATCA